MKHIKTYKLFENFTRPVISYDFDGVLHRSVSGIHPHDFLNWRSWEPFDQMFEQMKEDAVEHDIVVVTARSSIWEVQGAVNSYIAEHELPVTEVYYTDNMPKLPILKRIGAIKHYDDNQKMASELHGTGIEFQLVDPKIFESRDMWLREKDDFRDTHVAPTADDRPTKEKIEGHGDFTLAEVAQGYHSQPDDYFSPQGPRFYMYDTLEGRQSLTAIDNFIRYFKAHNEIPDRTITTYRAIPKKITGSKLIPGDWVTFSEEYAINHGGHRFGEDNYKIIKQEVSPYHVWWDSNDINEWGYDDSLNESLNEMMDGYQENGIVLIKGNELPNGKFRLYGAHIKKVLSYQRMKMDDEEGQAAKMVLLHDDLFRIKVVDRKLVTGKTLEKFNRTGMKSKKIVLNNNKTPKHWLTTKYKYFPNLFKELVDELRNMSDIEWYN